MSRIENGLYFCQTCILTIIFLSFTIVNVIKYFDQPITTEIKYESFRDDPEAKYPMISICERGHKMYNNTNIQSILNINGFKDDFYESLYKSLLNKTETDLETIRQKFKCDFNEYIGDVSYGRGFEMNYVNDKLKASMIQNLFHYEFGPCLSLDFDRIRNNISDFKTIHPIRFDLREDMPWKRIIIMLHR